MTLANRIKRVAGISLVLAASLASFFCGSMSNIWPKLWACYLFIAAGMIASIIYLMILIWQLLGGEQ
jgi:hypothetical protein